jgi:hypothetical protein
MGPRLPAPPCSSAMRASKLPMLASYPPLEACPNAMTVQERASTERFTGVDPKVVLVPASGKCFTARVGWMQARRW